MLLISDLDLRVQKTTETVLVELALSADNQYGSPITLERMIVGSDGGISQPIDQLFNLGLGMNEIGTQAVEASIFWDRNPDYVTLEFTNQEPITITGAAINLQRLACTDPTANNYDPLASRDNGSCVFIRRTGMKGYMTLEQYDRSNGQATGLTKPNLEQDPDYIAPTEDRDFCPPDNSGTAAQ